MVYLQQDRQLLIEILGYYNKLYVRSDGSSQTNILCPFGKPAYLAGIVYAMMWRDSFVPALIQQDGTLPFSL
jgi:hypothetical protein